MDVGLTRRGVTSVPDITIPVQNSLFHVWDPRYQDDSWLAETKRDGDQNADFNGGAAFVSGDAPHVALDGIDSYIRTPSIGKFDGFSADPGNNTTLMWVIRFNDDPGGRKHWFHAQLGRAFATRGVGGAPAETNVGIQWSGRTPHNVHLPSGPNEWMTFVYGFDPSTTKVWVNAVNLLDSDDAGTASHWNSFHEMGGKNNAEHCNMSLGFWIQWERLLLQAEIETMHNWVADNFSYSGISAV